MKKLVLLFSLLLLIIPTALFADSFEWDFQILPSNGDVSGAPGEIVGWGYQIINYATANWLAFDPDILSTDDNLPSFIDFPELGPGNSVLSPTALCELELLTSDLVTKYIGSIRLTAKWYSDEFITKIDSSSYLEEYISLSKPYTATEAVPEPTTLLLLASGLIGCLGWDKRKKQIKL